MKIRNLVIVFGLCVLGFISCTKDEALPSDSVEQEIEFRNDDDDGPEECCDFEWVIQSKVTEEACCTYEILVINNGNCQIQIAGLPNGILNPQTSRIYEITVCGEGVTTYNVSSNVNQTSTLCGAISLTADCSETCSCNVSIERNECILIANIGDDCEGPFTYLWTYPGGVTSTYVGDITALYSGQYCLLVTDANGCTSEDCITIDDCEDVIDDCGEDCVFSFQTVDMGKDVQFTNGIEIYHNCENPQFVLAGGGGGAPVFFKNESGCTILEAAEAWNSYPSNPGILTYTTPVSTYQNIVQTVVQSIEGCENAQMTIVKNNHGGLDYEIQYDCETCEIKHFQAVEWAFDVNDDCTDIDFPTDYNKEGGWTDCGACY